MKIPPFPSVLITIALRLAMPTAASSIAISGQVLDSASGTPLADIAVSLVGAGLSTTTDANGYWSLQGATGVVERSGSTANLSSHLVLRNGRIIILFDRSDACGRIAQASTITTSTARSAARTLTSDRDTIAYSQYGYQLATQNIGSYSQQATVKRINPRQWTFLVDPRDNQKYRTVTIGNQTWMAQNLNYAVSGSTCPLNDTAYCATYGRMYTWAATMGVSSSFNVARLNPVSPFQGVCPSGWHVPSDSEWNLLLNKDLDSSTAGKLLKANTHQWYVNTGTDRYGFSVLPAGDHIGSYGGAMGIHANFWSAAESDSLHSWRRIFDYDADTVRHKNDVPKSDGMSIRCVLGQGGTTTHPADTTAAADTVVHGTFVDSRDNQTYAWTKIGSQVWMARNLNYAASGSTCPLNDTSYCPTYGRMYTWATAMAVSDSFNTSKLRPVAPFQGQCPGGWHVPTDSEWNILVSLTLNANVAGKQLKAKSSLWQSNTGTDNYLFAAIPAGDHIGSTGGAMGQHANFWSSSEHETSYAWRRILDYDADTVRDKNDVAKSNGLSLRCVEGQGGSSTTLDTTTVADTVVHGTFVDSRDNQTYAWTKIGSQVWMARNLNYAASGSTCPLNDTSYCPTYGRMYDWSTAMDVSDSFNTAALSPSLPHRGICPGGWHIPSDSEWDFLLATTLDSSTAGKQLKARSSLWLTNTGADSHLFSAIPAGDHIGSVGGAMGYHANFWSSSERGQAYAWRRILDHDQDAVRHQSDVTKSNGMSVRCLEDSATE